MENNDKIKLITETTDQITKKFGKGSIMKLGETNTDFSMGAISTGSLPLDIALGIGGIPKGRMVEIYGPESSGKTTMALQTVAECQKSGGVAAYIDAENALDPTYASTLGVDVDNLLISQPDTGEQALQIAYMLAHSSAVDIIVIDSVAALVPKAELQGEMGDATVGLRARLLSQALPKLAGELAKTNTACLFINQLRQKIGVMFGNPETTPGGMALKFAASVRMDIRRVSWIKDSDQNAIGSHVRVKVVKNKVAPPFRQAEFDLMFGTGVSKAGCVLDMAQECGICKKSGAWYNYGETRLGQGRESAKTTLAQNPKLYNEIETQVRQHFGLSKNPHKKSSPKQESKTVEKSNISTSAVKKPKAN